MPIRTKKISDKEEKFIEKYVETLNGTESYLYAYPKAKPSSAKSGATRMLSNDFIKVEIEKRVAKRTAKNEITVDRILQELAKIAFSNVGDLFDPKTNAMKKVGDIDPSTLSAVSGISIDEMGYGKQAMGTTKKIKMYDKIRALEKLGHYVGLFKDKEETTEDVVKALKELFKDLPG